MSTPSNDSVSRETAQLEGLPDSLREGSTVLVAGAADPSRHAICLRILCACGTAEDTALVVTTTESANRTIEVYERLDSEAGRPALRLVDTTSEQQSVSALYGGTPVVFTPSPGDLERLVMALSEAAESAPPSNGARHLVVRSLTPILESAATSRVCTVLERITGLRSETGTCLLGIDYTAHDEVTMTAIAQRVDGVLWVTRSSSDRIEAEYQPTSGRFSRSVPEGNAGD